MIRFGDFETQALAPARQVRDEAIAQVLEILERGCDIGMVMRPAPYNQELLARIREQRKRLIERDLYELHYGELTPEETGSYAF